VIKVNFASQFASVNVHDSCGHYPFLWTYCTAAFPIVAKQPTRWICINQGFYPVCNDVINEDVNIVRLSESTRGTISVVWDVTQSIQPVVRPGLTVNGSMLIRPGWMYSDDRPRVVYHGDGFPSEEMYWFNKCSRTGCQIRRTVFHHRGEDFNDMNPGRGDWSGTYRLPQI